MSTTTAKTMTAKNKAFWAKSKPMQRVAVAKDVLSSLAAKSIKAVPGTYFEIHGVKKAIYAPPHKLDDLFSIFKRQNVTCEVCGIGGCFFSLVKLGNQLTTKRLLGDTIDNFDGIHNYNMRPHLRKVFSSEQLSLIECAFEESENFEDRDEVDPAKRIAAANFGSKYKSDTARLKAIMLNIIKNKGKFIP